MRRSASEIIRNLEMRIARLEAKKASHNTVYTVAKNEVNAINQLSKKMKPKDLELVLLNALSHNLNKHRDALTLSKGLGLTSNNLWLGDKRIARISNILVANKVLSVESLGKVFAQYCRDFASKKERNVLRMLKSIGVSLKEYDLNVFDDIMELLYPNFDLSDWGLDIGDYKTISLEEDEDENDWGDHGFDYEYGSQRGYHSQTVERVVIRTAKAKATLSFSELDNEKMVDLHPSFDFIVNLIDLNQVFDLDDWQGADWGYELADGQESLGGYHWELEDIKWGSVSLKNGKLYFYVEWEVCSEEEEEEDMGGPDPESYWEERNDPGYWD